MTYEGHKIREAEKEERLSTGKVIKMMEIWKRDEKEEGDSDKKRKKTEKRVPPSCFLSLCDQ